MTGVDHIPDIALYRHFAVNQFDFWTKNEFAVAFRKMLMLEQYKSPEKMKQYQEMICEGPVKYSEDLLSSMIK